MSTDHPRVVYLFTFILAFCSLFYELVYAQVLSVCLGGTKNQYLLIISLFTCALGFGSIVQGKLKLRYELRKIFFIIEVLLTVLGSTGPFLITWILQPGSSPVLQTVTMVASYLVVFVIGFLSGFEIPSLFAMVKDSQGKILAFDYLGMLAASVTFPFIFLPYFGTAASTLLVAGANMLALVWLRSDRPDWRVSIGLYSSCFLYLFYVAFFRVELDRVLSELYLGGP